MFANGSVASCSGHVRGDHEVTPHGVERLLDLFDTGSVVGVGEFAGGRCAHAEPAGEFRIGDVLGAHGCVEGEFAAIAAGTTTIS